jgi:hypothetical protein
MGRLSRKQLLSRLLVLPVSAALPSAIVKPAQTLAAPHASDRTNVYRRHIRFFLVDESAGLYVIWDDGTVYWYQDRGSTALGIPNHGTISFARGGVGAQLATGWPKFREAAYCGDGTIYALDEEGNLRWYQDLARNGTVRWAARSGDIVKRGWSRHRIIAGDAKTGDIYAVDEDGNLHWIHIESSAGARSFDDRVIATGWNAFSAIFCGGGGILYAVLPNGTMKWYQHLIGDRSSNFGPLAPASGADIGAALGSEFFYGSDLRGNIYCANALGGLSRTKDPARDGTARLEPDHWQVITSGWDSNASVRGYCTPLSVAPGEEIAIRLSAGARVKTCKVTFYRLRLNGDSFGDKLTDAQTVNLTWQPVPPTPWSQDHGWRATVRHVVPAGWRSGLYAAECIGEDGDGFYVSFVVKPGHTKQSPIAVIASTNTWNAYNEWGGRSQYTSPNGTPLTFNRPNPAASPIGNGKPDSRVRGELYVLSTLERLHVKYDLYADVDLHRKILDPSRYRALILNTHPEYYTLEMRNALVEYLAHGGSIIYLGGNGVYERVIFQLHYAGLEFRQNVSASPPPPRWLFKEQGLPEREILGVGYDEPRSVTFAPYQVLLPGHKFFRNTGVANGQLLGATGYSGGASGWECDRISYPGGTPANIEMLAKGTNPDGFGAEMTYYETGHGGFVFSASSLTFGGSLFVDPVLRKVLQNVLDEAVGVAQ